MIKRLLNKWALFLAIGILGLARLFIFPSGSVYAQDSTPGENLDRRLENGYTRLQIANENLQVRLDRTAEIIAKGEEWIAKLQADGVDTAVLEEALAAYEASVAEAQQLADSGSQILADHAGFDDSGSVTDRQEAISTLRDAGRNLRDSHRTLRDASIDLRRVVADFRREHRGN